MAAFLVILRAALALEFAGALGAWALGALRWELAGVIATSTLIGFMSTWGDARGEVVPPSSRVRENRASGSRYW